MWPSAVLYHMRIRVPRSGLHKVFGKHRVSVKIKMRKAGKERFGGCDARPVLPVWPFRRERRVFYG